MLGKEAEAAPSGAQLKALNPFTLEAPQIKKLPSASRPPGVINPSADGWFGVNSITWNYSIMGSGLLSHDGGAT